MTATATAPAGRDPHGAPRHRRRGHRLLPRPLLVIVTVVLCAMVLIPTAYIVLASLNTDIGVAEGQFWPSSFSPGELHQDLDHRDLATGLVNSIIVCGVHGGGVGAARHHHRVRAGALHVPRPAHHPARAGRPAEHPRHADAAAGVRAVLVAPATTWGSRWSAPAGGCSSRT